MHLYLTRFMSLFTIALALHIGAVNADDPSIDVETMKLKRKIERSNAEGSVIGGRLAEDNTHSYYFIGKDGDWFNGANWVHGESGRTGIVPGAGDEAVIGNNSIVYIDGQAHGAAVPIGMILQFGASRLEVLPNTLLQYDNYLAIEQSTIALFSAAMEPTTPSGGGGGSGTGWGCRSCGFSNPSSVVTSLLDLKSGHFQFGLGGVLPARSGATGQGHYANFVADSVLLDGAHLSVALHYGFTPTAGDVFEIFSIVQQASGRFVNAAEGTRVAVLGNVALEISYSGGDGNDIVLKATPVPVPGGPGLTVGALGLLMVALRHGKQRATA